MKTTVDVDDELAAEVERTCPVIHEQPATVSHLAIEAGLPLVVSRAQTLRSEGYFADNYPATRRQTGRRSSPDQGQKAAGPVEIRQWEIWKCRPEGFERSLVRDRKWSRTL